MTLVINLFGGPGCGKSTTSAGLFYKMKKLGLSVELVTEYAKEKVWDNSIEIMADQLYLLAKQNRRLDRLIDKVDYIISDSPLLLCAYYGNLYGKHKDLVCPLSIKLFNKYNNVNIFIKRTKVFSKMGRLGSFEDALQADEGIKELVHIYTEFEDNPSTIDKIISLIL